MDNQSVEPEGTPVQLDDPVLHCKGRTNSRPLWRSKTRPVAAAA